MTRFVQHSFWIDGTTFTLTFDGARMKAKEIVAIVRSLRNVEDHVSCSDFADILKSLRYDGWSYDSYC